MKKSTFLRTIELAKLAAHVGIKEIRSGDIKSRIEQAAAIAKSLSNLKGAAMKMGQLLSLDLNHYFPPEAIEVLSQLQNSAVAHSFAEMEEILRAELGDTKFAKIQKISQTPLGVASIGQVHKAQFENKDIVFKIQYPGVADSIESDLKILKTIAVSFCQLTGRKMDLTPLFDEFKNILEQEVNYSKESEYQYKFQNLTSKIDLGTGVNFRVPTLIPEMSSSRIMAMTYEQGIILRSWIQSRPSKEKREKIATSILDLYFYEFFNWGMVQTDPNWANFLIDDSDDKLNLVLLDFGATRLYTREFIANYIKLLQYASENNFSELKRHAIAFKLIDPRESDSAFWAFENMIKTAIKPFFTDQLGTPSFDFTDLSHSRNSNESAKALAEKLVFSPPPYGIIFLHRKLAGVYSILRALEVKLDLSGYWQKMKDLSA